MTRREFLKACAALLAALTLGRTMPKKVFAQVAGSNARRKKNIKGDHDLVAAKGQDPHLTTVKAVESMGGMGKFVSRGGVVVIKPNIGWDRTPEQAGNTNPDVVAALVELAFNAGAKKVNIFDFPCNDPRRCYDNSGIMKAAREKGANVYFPDDWNTVEARFAYSSPMEGWPILKDALECDTFINVPVLKDHGLTGLTISMKNLMGVCGGNRGLIHNGIGRKLVDLTDFVSPELIVIDAFRILVRNGPTGGNLRDVEQKNTVIAATDPTLADTYAARFAGRDPFSISNIQYASQINFGSTDIERSDILEVTV